MKSLPSNLELYKTTPTFDQNTTPTGLLNNHSTKEGTWGKICVIKGELLYTIEPTGEQIRLNPDNPGTVEPEVLHKVGIVGEVEFYVEFYK